MITEQCRLWMGLSYCQGVGLKTWQRYFADFSPTQFFQALSLTQSLPPLPAALKEQLRQIPWSQVDKDSDWCQKQGLRVICYEDSLYPALLKEIASPPPLLYLWGEPSLLSQPQLAIVGSRKATYQGLAMAQAFSSSLAATGWIITSGLALGIDTASHQGALAAKGKTIAVLGTGLAHIYPRQNMQLADKIKQDGLLISEFPPFSPPKATHFPRRNRLISGLSVGTLIVEASLASGSLITAKFALEQNREVFAIPGSIHQVQHKGCHWLLKQGAKLVESVEDILDELPLLPPNTVRSGLQASQLLASAEELDKKWQNMIQYIGFEVTPIDVIITRSGLSASVVAGILHQLELKLVIKFEAGGYVRIK